MGCADRRAGLPDRVAPQPIRLPDRLALVEYRGVKDRDRFAKSALTGNAYEYGTERPCFYVDTLDLSRILAWSESGECAFRVVDNGSSHQEN